MRVCLCGVTVRRAFCRSQCSIFCPWCTPFMVHRAYRLASPARDLSCIPMHSRHEIALLFVFCFMIFSCSSTHWASAFGSCSPIKTFAVFIFQVFDVFRFSLSLSFSLSLVDEQNQCSTCPSCRQVSSEFPTTLRKTHAQRATMTPA